MWSAETGTSCVSNPVSLTLHPHRYRITLEEYCRSVFCEYSRALRIITRSIFCPCTACVFHLRAPGGNERFGGRILGVQADSQYSYYSTEKQRYKTN
jgi:hypothetical protein